MTTRSLIVVIVVLAVIDIVAGVWYLDGKLNDNGKSPFTFSFNDSDAVEASTVAESVGNDEFSTMSDNAYFVTDKPVDVGGMSDPLSSTMRIKAKWPKRVNGDTEPRALTEALLGKMFATSYADLASAIKSELSHPVFCTATNEKYSKVNESPIVTERFSHVQSVKAYPVMNSNRLLVYEVDKKTFGDAQSGTSKNTQFVVYDRLKGKVLSLADMVADGNDNKVLALINKKIDTINGKTSRFGHARVLPDNVRVKHEGLLFYFQSGELGSSEVEIYIALDAVKKLLTPSFADIMKSNGDFVDFKPITFQ